MTLERFAEIVEAHEAEAPLEHADQGHEHRGELIEAYRALHKEHYRLVAATCAAAAELAKGVA